MDKLPLYIQNLEKKIVTETFYQIDKIKSLYWSSYPSTELIYIKDLKVTDKLYNCFWNFKQQEDLDTFLTTFKRCVLEDNIDLYNISYRKHDIKKIVNKEYLNDIDDVLEKEPILIFKKNRNIAIVDGMHRFLGKYAKELKNNFNTDSILIKCYLATTVS